VVNMYALFVEAEQTVFDHGCERGEFGGEMDFGINTKFCNNRIKIQMKMTDQLIDNKLPQVIFIAQGKAAHAGALITINTLMIVLQLFRVLHVGAAKSADGRYAEG